MIFKACTDICKISLQNSYQYCMTAIKQKQNELLFIKENMQADSLSF